MEDCHPGLRPDFKRKSDGFCADNPSQLGDLNILRNHQKLASSSAFKQGYAGALTDGFPRRKNATEGKYAAADGRLSNVIIPPPQTHRILHGSASACITPRIVSNNCGRCRGNALMPTWKYYGYLRACPQSNSPTQMRADRGLSRHSRHISYSIVGRSVRRRRPHLLMPAPPIPPYTPKHGTPARVERCKGEGHLPLGEPLAPS